MSEVTLIGEVFAGQERSASLAISSVLNQLNERTDQFNVFFRPVGLTIKDWIVEEVIDEREGFYVVIKAVAQACQAIQDIPAFIESHASELYFDLGGYVPELAA